MFNNLFLKAGYVDVDAAVLGIGRERWISATLEENKVDVLQRMKDNRFDILPIEDSKNSPIYFYYYFESTGSEETIEKKQIVYEDLISANTPAIDIIEKFVKKNRNFFFLTHENQIVGLITFSELNNHQMKLAIFALTCELETLLGRFISKNTANSQVIEKYLKGESLSLYESDKVDPLKNDRNVIEYLYLVDLLKVIGKEGLFKNLGYSTKKEFDNRLGTLNELRKSVAHPVKSLVSKDSPVSKLWERIELTNDALFRLRQQC